MALISGFTFIHNAFEGGYPIREAINAVRPYVDEIVVVDLQSTDGTRELLDRTAKYLVNLKIIDGAWDNRAGETLAAAHQLHTKCSGDVIVHFEGDEVYDDRLIRTIRRSIDNGKYDILVYRLQLEQNFQRCRWYPELVHRVFPKGSVKKIGHTTDRAVNVLHSLPVGFLWDITNCFRDNWRKRIENQAQLRFETCNYMYTPHHTNAERNLSPAELLEQPHWLWKQTPFDIPAILKPLVGKVKYE